MKRKRCTSCEKKKPANSKNFHKSKLGAYGFTSRCKECISKTAAKHYAAKIGRPVKTRKPNLESWQPSPGDKFDAYLGHNLCELGPFKCVNNSPGKVTATTDEGIWGLDKAEFIFLKAG